MPIAGGDNHDIPGAGDDHDHLGTIPCLDQVMCFSGKYFVDLRVAGSARILRVIMSFGLDVFPAEITGGDYRYVKTDLLTFYPFLILTGLRNIAIHVIDGAGILAIRMGEYSLEIFNGPD
jgi:hypothetical protein